jgi:HD-GYP domain-containing protein (c-di-GMP phosphodiesterase class II)
LKASLAADERYALLPESGFVEVVYLLRGSLEFSLAQLKRPLYAGSFVVADEYSPPMTLRASSQASFLKFSFRKQRHDKGQELSIISSRSGLDRLLVSRGGKELSYSSFKAGEQFFLSPHDEPGAQEFYLVLEGCLSLEEPGFHRRFKPGDAWQLMGLDKKLRLQAQEDTAFLCFSSLPSFEQRSTELQDLMRLAVDVEEKDGYTANHCQRLQTLSLRTGEVLGLVSDRLYALSLAAYFHDIGKLKIPLEILQKPAVLNSEEWALIKEHPRFGRDLLQETSFNQFADIVAQHHERMDGSGYPLGLSGEQIALEAYIIAAADTYDAMTTDRPYRKALLEEVAFAELRRLAGKQLPAMVVEAFIRATRANKEIP